MHALSPLAASETARVCRPLSARVGALVCVCVFGVPLPHCDYATVYLKACNILELEGVTSGTLIPPTMCVGEPGEALKCAVCKKNEHICTP